MATRKKLVKAVGPSGFLRFKNMKSKTVLVNIFDISSIEPYKTGSKVRMKKAAGGDEPGIVYKAKAKPPVFSGVLERWGVSRYG